MPRDNIAGLMLHDRAVHWTVLSRSKGAFAAVHSGGGPLESGEDAPGLFAAASDEARDRLAADLRVKCDRLSGAVSVGIPSSRVLMRVINVPDAPPEELRGMVELQSDKLSPFPLEKASVSFERLSGGEGMTRLLVAIVQLDLLDSVRATLDRAGIAVRRVDVSVLGWWRLLSDANLVRPSGRQPILLRDGPDCDIIVAQDGVPLTIRALGAAGGLSEEDFAAEVAREVAYTLTSVEVEYGPNPLAPLALWHGGDVPGLLVERLRSDCSIEVETRALSSLAPLSEGLARRAAAREPLLDLSAPAWRTAERAARTRRKLVGASALIVALWLMGVGGAVVGVQVQRQRLSSAQKELSRLETDAAGVRDLMNRVRALSVYSDRTHSALECLLEITRLQPAAVTLNSCVYKKAKSITLTGDATAASAVYEFKQALDKSELFGPVALEGPSRDRSGKEIFRLTIQLPEIKL